jgi:hypothetical protein
VGAVPAAAVAGGGARATRPRRLRSGAAVRRVLLAAERDAFDATDNKGHGVAVALVSLRHPSALRWRRNARIEATDNDGRGVAERRRSRRRGGAARRKRHCAQTVSRLRVARGHVVNRIGGQAPQSGRLHGPGTHAPGNDGAAAFRMSSA